MTSFPRLHLVNGSRSCRFPARLLAGGHSLLGLGSQLWSCCGAFVPRLLDHLGCHHQIAPTPMVGWMSIASGCRNRRAPFLSHMVRRLRHPGSARSQVHHSSVPGSISALLLQLHLVSASSEHLPWRANGAGPVLWIIRPSRLAPIFPPPARNQSCSRALRRVPHLELPDSRLLYRTRT